MIFPKKHRVFGSEKESDIVIAEYCGHCNTAKSREIDTVDNHKDHNQEQHCTHEHNNDQHDLQFTNKNNI